MSKAFAPNDAIGDEDDDESADAFIPHGGKNYITPAGQVRLLAELNHLIRVERPQVVNVVSWAASNGDRSENGDYIYGKKRLREIDRRIRFLTKRLDTAEVVDPLRQEQSTRVFFGATVTVRDDSGIEATYSIVGIDEANASVGRISWISPLAHALLKADEGDIVRFHAPGGWRELEILVVEYKALD